MIKWSVSNSEVRCHTIQYNPSSPIEIESINSLSIDEDNYEIFAKYFFNRIKHLQLTDLSTDQIKHILTKFNRTDKLDIIDLQLEGIDFTQSKIKNLIS